MQASIADAVHAVFNKGLSLRDRHEAGELIDWDLERASLGELLSWFEAEADNPFAGDLEGAYVFTDLDPLGERDQLMRVTIRHALTCWLDEWLLSHLKADRLSDRDGGASFWEEARYAETRGDLDTLEVMYLCVMLGFRGSWQDKAQQVEAWATRIGAKLAQAGHPWAMPASLEAPPVAVPQLADMQLRRMAFSVLLTFALLLPLAAALLWRL